VPLARFTVLTAAGCALWALAFVVLGALSGTAWSSVSSLAGQVSVGAVVVGTAVWGVRRLHRRR
jgi:membrane protein DedA with SNARE-associated domain